MFKAIKIWWVNQGRVVVNFRIYHVVVTLWLWGATARVNNLSNRWFVLYQLFGWKTGYKKFLLAKVNAYEGLVASMQRDAEKYLVPDNDCHRDWFINRVLWHLDGPKTEAIQRIKEVKLW